MNGVVTGLGIAPVKGMRMARAEWLEIGPAGAVGDRAFFVIDAASHELLLTTRHPKLVQIAPHLDSASRTLCLRFPDGSAVTGPVTLGAPATTANYAGRPIPGRIVEGPFAGAISAHLGRSVALLERDSAAQGPDDGAVSLMSAASLAALGAELGGDVPDPRRFRMTVAMDGVPAWAEHAWSGREIVMGEAVLRGIEPVPRCVVTTRDPDDGRRDVPVLAALAALRGKRDVTFGLWCDVVAPGRVRVGDPISLRD